MLERILRFAPPCAGLVLALAAAGCGNLSKVDDRGHSASPVWPKMDVENMTLLEGVHPNPNNLAQVKTGMTKDQLYHLLGRPHFLEGFFFVREWDYLFHLKTPSGEQACQYKILFDRDMTARSFHWKEPSCAAAAPTASENKDSGADRA